MDVKKEKKIQEEFLENLLKVEEELKYLKKNKQLRDIVYRKALSGLRKGVKNFKLEANKKLNPNKHSLLEYDLNDLIYGSYLYDSIYNELIKDNNIEKFLPTVIPECSSIKNECKGIAEIIAMNYNSLIGLILAKDIQSVQSWLKKKK